MKFIFKTSIFVGVLAMLSIGYYFLILMPIPTFELSEDFPSSIDINKIDNWLEKLKSDGKFNGAVLISEDHKPLLMKSYGFTDKNLKKELTNKSYFRLASVSKQFTAACILILVERKKLELDDFAHKFLPNLPYKNVSVRNLLNNTSGIPDKYIDLALKNKNEFEPALSINEAIKLIIKEKLKPTFEPNENFSYSNTNYILLAGIIEKISGQTFESFILDNLFRPLGMKNCRVWNLLSTDSTFSGKTSSYFNLGVMQKELDPSFIDGVAGDGGVFCSIHDFLVWDKFWYDNKLISPNLLKQAFLKPILNNGETSDYGFGWLIDSEIVYHSGKWLGARTYIRRNTKNKRCLVILDNSRNLRMNKIIKELKRTTDNN